MAPHSSTFAWKIPWTEEPGRLQILLPIRLCSNHAICILGRTQLSVQYNLPLISNASLIISSAPNHTPIQPVQFSHSVMSDSLRTHGLQQAKLPCPSPTLGAYSISYPSISDAIHPSHPLSSPYPPAFNLSSSRVFSNESVLHIWWTNIGVSASVLPMNIQD